MTDDLFSGGQKAPTVNDQYITVPVPYPHRAFLDFAPRLGGRYYGGGTDTWRFPRCNLEQVKWLYRAVYQRDTPNHVVEANDEHDT